MATELLVKVVGLADAYRKMMEEKNKELKDENCKLKEETEKLKYENGSLKHDIEALKDRLRLALSRERSRERPVKKMRGSLKTPRT